MQSIGMASTGLSGLGKESGVARAVEVIADDEAGMKFIMDLDTIQQGETKTVIWKFSKRVQGNIVFACQMLGHYDAGMAHQAKLAKAKKTS